MTKIKYIHCFGTSHTAGGGFEFNATVKERDDIIRKYYSIDGEELTQYNFSYPGQLQKIIGNKIKVLNHAKQGYGNDRMMRIFYDIINQSNFNKDEHIFIFEFSGLGRREYFLNPINDFITINWQHQYNDINPFKKKKKDKIVYATLNDAVSSYFYETIHNWNFFGETKDFFKKYVEYFVNWDVEFKKVMMESEFFITYLSKLNFKYIFSSPPSIIDYDKSKEVWYGDDVLFLKNNDMIQFVWQNELTINSETNGGYYELHNGFKANKLCAHIIHNKLIDESYLDSSKIEIDWEWYKNTKFVKPKLL